MTVTFRKFNGITGGGFGKLDSWDGNLLSDGFLAEVIESSGGTSTYVLNATSGASTNAPFRIPPAINPGTKVWHLVGTTARIGALVSLTSAFEIADDTNLVVEWGTDSAIGNYDDTNFWVIGSPTKLTIPIGVTRVKVCANIRWANDNTGERQGMIRKNGSVTPGIGSDRKNAIENTEANFHTAKINVVATDYFEVRAYQTSGGPLDLLLDTQNWFSIEAVGFA